MTQTCPKCRRQLDFPGDPIAFCPFCGSSMTALPGTTDALDPDATLAPARDARLEMPERLGTYRLLRKLGQGGMGAVFEGEHESTGRHVAVKLIDAEATTDALERFRQEGRLASAVSHPRCVFVFAADEDEGRPYIVLELMPGRTLEDLVQERGPLPVKDALQHAFDLIEGLEQVHRLGVIHRDVKPSNCFLDEDGRVKVGDFGLARSLKVNTKLTRTGAFVGTPLFAAPEQILSQPLDARADVYAVCATLFYLLTGKAPHDRGDRDYMAVLARVVSDEAPSVRTHRPDLPVALANVLARGLARDRERRWADLDELRRALGSFGPARSSWRVLATRLCAYLVDTLVLYPVNLVAGEVFQATPALAAPGELISLGPPPAVQVSYFVAKLLYYTLCDGLLRGTAGKWIFGLRTLRSDEVATPGLLRGFVRSLVWVGLVLGPTVVVSILLPMKTPADVLLGSLIMGSAMLVAGGSLFGPMRPRNGFRGLHEWLSGTRVVVAPEKSTRPTYSTPERAAENLPEGGPAQIGPYRVEGIVHGAGADRTIVALDTGLGRHVWLRLRPMTEPAVDARRRDLFRPARLRWLAAGEYQGERWDAFLAPRGGPIAEVVRRHGRMSWDEARPVLEQLVAELDQASATRSLPETLSLAQVWLSASGEVQLLDEPPPGEKVEELRPEDLLAQAAALMLDGALHDGVAGAELPRAPLPGGARRLLAELPYFGGEERDLGYLRTQLEEMRDRPGRVTRLHRVLHLGALCVLGGWLGSGCWAGGLVIAPISLMMQQQFLQMGRGIDEGLTAEAVGEVGLLVAPVPGPLARVAPAALLGRSLPALETLRGSQRSSEQFVAARRANLSLPLRYMLDRFLTASRQQALPNRPRGSADEAVRFAEMMSGGVLDQIYSYTGAIMLAVFPATCVLSAFAFRGGLRYYPLGLEIVRADGRRAGRFRCAWRALAAWGPPFALLIASRILEDQFWMAWTPGSDMTMTTVVVPAMQALAYGIVIIAAVVAVVSPTRALHDRVAGTCLVPR